jgi:hypothetical protein
MTATIEAAATIQPLILFDSNRRTRCQRACSAAAVSPGLVD